MSRKDTVIIRDGVKNERMSVTVPVQSLMKEQWTFSLRGEHIHRHTPSSGLDCATSSIEIIFRRLGEPS